MTDLKPVGVIPIEKPPISETKLVEMQVAKEALPTLERELRALHPMKDRVAVEEKRDAIKLARMTAMGKKELGEKIIAKQQAGRARRDAKRKARMEE